MKAENVYVYRLKGEAKLFPSIREAAEKFEGVENAALDGDALTLELSPSASEYDIFCALNEMCLGKGVDFDYYEEAPENADKQPVSASENTQAKNEETVKNDEAVKASPSSEAKKTTSFKAKKRELDDDSKPAFKRWAVQLIELALSLILILVAVIFDIDQSTKTFLCLIAYTVVAYETIWSAVSAIWKKRFFDWSVGGLIAIIAVLFACGNYVEPAVVALLVQSVITLGGLLSDLNLDKIKKRLFFKYQVVTPENQNEDDDEILAVDAKEGETYLFKKGEVVPFDGTVTKGVATVDGFNYSGKHLPVVAQKGDTLYGGAKVKEGEIVVRVENKVTKSLSYKIYKRIKNETPSKFSVILLALSLLVAFVLPLVYIGGDGYVAGLKKTAYFAVCLFLVSETYTLATINRISRISAVYRALTDGFVNASESLLTSLSGVNAVVFDGESLFETKIVKMVCNARYKGKAAALLNTYGFNADNLGLEFAEYTHGETTLTVLSESECSKHGLEVKPVASELPVRYAFIDNEFVCAIVFDKNIKKDAFGAMHELYDAKIKLIILYGGNAEEFGKINEFFEVRANLSKEEKQKQITELCANGNAVYFGNESVETLSFKIQPYAGEKTDKACYLPEGSVRAAAKAVKGAKRFASRKKLCILAIAFKVIAIAFCGVMTFALGESLMWVAVLIAEVFTALAQTIAFLFGREIY